MQAQRKPADPALTASPAEERVAPVDYQSPTSGDYAASPAVLLQEQLAARIAAAGPAQAQDMTGAPEYKLPMALRVVTIVALSLILWAGIVLSAVAVLT